jgi:hypothetical protein
MTHHEKRFEEIFYEPCIAPSYTPGAANSTVGMDDLDYQSDHVSSVEPNDTDYQSDHVSSVEPNDTSDSEVSECSSSDSSKSGYVTRDDDDSELVEASTETPQEVAVGQRQADPDMLELSKLVIKVLRARI